MHKISVLWLKVAHGGAGSRLCHPHHEWRLVVWPARRHGHRHGPAEKQQPGPAARQLRAAGAVWTHQHQVAGNHTFLIVLIKPLHCRNRAAQRAQRDSQILFQTLYFKDRPLSDPRCVVDAVIFSLRDNGVLVYIPQYAIKGPVYLESKEKEVMLWLLCERNLLFLFFSYFRCCSVVS